MTDQGSKKHGKPRRKQGGKNGGNQPGHQVHTPEPRERPVALELTRGGLCFPALSQGQGEVVLLLHGFPDCYLNWREQMALLAAAGFRAVAVSLRGYAPSCLAEDGDYSLIAAADDINAWADQLGGRVHLVGHDWGAAASYIAVARDPSRFVSFTALSIPPVSRLGPAIARVPEQLRLSWYMAFFQLPWLPERRIRKDHFAFIERLWRDWSPGWEPGHWLEPVRGTLSQPGVLDGALGWYRGLGKFWTPAYRQGLRILGRRIHVPTLIVAGERDGCMSSKLYDYTIRDSDFPEGVRFEALADAGHFLHLEQPAAFNRLLLQHLRA